MLMAKEPVLQSRQALESRLLLAVDSRRRPVAFCQVEKLTMIMISYNMIVRIRPSGCARFGGHGTGPAG